MLDPNTTYIKKSRHFLLHWCFFPKTDSETHF